LLLAYFLATAVSVRSVTAASLTPILGPGGFTSPTTFTHDFEGETVNAAPANTAQFTFEPTSKLVPASLWTDSVTPSGTQGLVEAVDVEPMTIAFNSPVHEVGAFFGNDDFDLTFQVVLEIFDAANSSLGSVQVAANSNDFADQYIGVRSDTAIKSAAFYYQRPNAGELSVYIDDLKVGVAVPEPTGLLLVLSGMLILAVRARWTSLR
jgi:hypothetical protein